MINSETRRTAHSRRTDYKKHRRQDRWMVPLLARNLDNALVECARHFGSAPRCLDVGCGGQPLRARLVELGFAYTSLDVEQNDTGTVEHLGAVDGPLPETLKARSFELVICTEVLEHVADWPQAFRNLSALLAPGGRLLLTCPHIWVPHEEPYDFFRPTNWALEFHAKSAGLDIVYARRLGDGYDVLGTVLAAVRVRAPRTQPWMWLIAGPLSLLRKLSLGLLSLSFVRRILILESPLYLSTLAVFERPAAGPNEASE